LIRVGRPQSLACSPASSWVGRPLSEDQGASSHSEVQQDYEVSPFSSASGGENQENIQTAIESFKTILNALKRYDNVKASDKQEG
jgi:hypothetical protein